MEAKFKTLSRLDVKKCPVISDLKKKKAVNSLSKIQGNFNNFPIPWFVVQREDPKLCSLFKYS